MNLNIIIYNLYIVLMDTQLKDKILPKNFDSNKLINPDIVLEEEDEDEEEEIDETIDEMDDETLEIINRMRSKKINSDQSNFFEDKPKNIKESNAVKVEKSSKKEKKKLSLQELNKVIKEDNKPTIKKFTSKRVEDKKSHNDPIFPKRQFNPKKPPYNFTRKVSSTIIPNYNNTQEFPGL